MLPILILAAGSSRRMRGADKLLEDVDGTPQLRRIVQFALEVSDDVRVALPPRPHPRYDVLPATARPVEVPDAAEGMAVSLRTLLATLPPSCPRAMVLLSDVPDIEPADMRAVTAAMEKEPDALIWRGATQDGQPGHPMIINAALFPEFMALTGDAGGRSVARAHKDRTVLVPLAGMRARRDLDTPEDWAEWRAERATSDD